MDYSALIATNKGWKRYRPFVWTKGAQRIITIDTKLARISYAPTSVVHIDGHDTRTVYESLCDAMFALEGGEDGAVQIW
jgi:hypothetical protein